MLTEWLYFLFHFIINELESFRLNSHWPSLEKKKKGNTLENVNNLRYADDTTLMVESEIEHIKMWLNILRNYGTSLP